MKDTWHPICVLIVFSVVFMQKCTAGTYEQRKSIFDNYLNSSVYNPQLRPLDDQTSTLEVGVSFELVSIIGIDDVGEKFMVNGFLILVWTDQRLQWNPADYGDEPLIRPKVKDIWKPRVLLLNTLTERDLFEDNNSPLYVDHNGYILWGPGGVFSTSCDLDMQHFPYDTQTCKLQLITNGYRSEEVALSGTNLAAALTFFSPSGEWDLIHSNVTSATFPLSSITLSGVEVIFTLKRKSAILVITVVVPIILLSFLNILVFLVPVDSGEKLSYGITVLLAISVFLSIISSLLPKSAKVVPNMTIYLACLLILSVLTVIDCIIIIFLHNLEEHEDASIKSKENFQRSVNKVKLANSAVAPMPMSLTPLGQLPMKTNLTDADMNTPSGSPVDKYDEPFPLHKKESNNSLGGLSKDEATRPRKNKYRLIGKYIDLVSFVVFMVIWFSMTIGFMAFTAGQ